MSFVHFVYLMTDTPGVSLPNQDIDGLRATLRQLPGLRRGMIYTPAQARDFYTDDGPSPALALQLYYDDLPTLEETLRRGAALDQCIGAMSFQAVHHQVMVVRPYPVRDARWQQDGEAPRCAYLVHYPGAAEDFTTWLDYYLDHHPQIMKDFPRIREIEIYSKCDWRDSLDWTRVGYMQRNRLIFDSAAALEEALNSSVRHTMRQDFESFPPFTGENIHYPMFLEDLDLEATPA